MKTYSPFSTVAIELSNNGYAIVPIKPGTKYPAIYRNGTYWPKTGWTIKAKASEIEGQMNWPDAGVGVLTGIVSGIVVVDLDNDVDGLHALIEKILPDSPVKKKGAKGCSIFYKYTPNLEKKFTRSLKGQTVIEILSNGQQTVLPPSIHPNGEPYIWITTRTLLDTTAEELPELTDAHLETISELFKGEGYQKFIPPYPAPKNPDGYTPGIVGSNTARILEKDDLDINIALSYLNPDDYNLWIETGMSLKHEYGDAGFQLWDSWSARSAKYQSGETQKKWKTFEGDQRTIASVIYDAQQFGYQKPSRTPIKILEGGNLSVFKADKNNSNGNESRDTAVNDNNYLNFDYWEANRRFIGKAPAVEWLVEGMIPKNKVGLFASQGGIGKSFLMLELARLIANYTGHPLADCFLGHPIRCGGKVLYFTAEDDQDEIHRRLDAIDPERNMRKNIHVMPLSNAGHFSIIEQAANNYRVTKEFEQLAKVINSYGDISLIIFDPLQSFANAKINEDPAAAQFLHKTLNSLAATKKAGIILVHHMRKPEAPIMDAEGAKLAIRGTTALVDGARYVIALFQSGAKKGNEICEKIGQVYTPNKVISGCIVKANSKYDPNIFYLVRNDATGLLERTYYSKSIDPEALKAELLNTIEKQYLLNSKFMKTGKKGLYTNSIALGGDLISLSKSLIEKLATDLLIEGKLIKDEDGFLKPAVPITEFPNRNGDLEICNSLNNNDS